MSPELALKLVPIFEGYFNHGEFRELVALFEVSLESLDNYEPKWLAVARELTQKLEQGNTRRLLDSLLDLAESRNIDGIAHTSWERQDFHRSMAPVIAEAKDIILKSGVPSNFTIATSSSMVGVGSSADHLRMLVRNHSIASR